MKQQTAVTETIQETVARIAKTMPTCGEMKTHEAKLAELAELQKITEAELRTLSESLSAEESRLREAKRLAAGEAFQFTADQQSTLAALQRKLRTVHDAQILVTRDLDKARLEHTRELVAAMRPQRQVIVTETAKVLDALADLGRQDAEIVAAIASRDVDQRHLTAVGFPHAMPESESIATWKSERRKEGFVL